MPHTKARRFKPQVRLEPAQRHWWQARKADVLTVTARVTPSHNQSPSPGTGVCTPYHRGTRRTKLNQTSPPLPDSHLCIHPLPPPLNRLVGLVVKASASKSGRSWGSNPACAGIFPGSSHTSDFKIGSPVATLPGAWRDRVSDGTGWPSVSILWLGEMESWIFNFYLSVAARKLVWEDPSLRYTRMLQGCEATNKQQQLLPSHSPPPPLWPWHCCPRSSPSRWAKAIKVLCPSNRHFQPAIQVPTVK